MPLIMSALKGRPSFSTSVRLVRILYTVLRKHLVLLPTECSDALDTLTQLLDQESTVWKRALCMEVFRGIFAEHSLVRLIYAMYDSQAGQRDILKTLTATFVRISTEKPAVIGLGHQSSIPVADPQGGSGNPTDHSLLDAGGMAGMISGSVGPEASNIGISVQWSQIRIPCIDQLDKTEPPAIPESYIYSLILACISSLSDGLAKFVLPLTVPTETKPQKRVPSRSDTEDASSPRPVHLEAEPTPPHGRPERSSSFKKNPIPLNPLDLKDHALYNEIKTCAEIVDECWPAILATCSTFLFAALDSDYYHGLVRAFQRFAHVAGLLQLSTPRDAFLTTLGKSAVPPNVLTACLAAGGVRPQTPNTMPETPNSILSNPKGLLSVESVGPLSPGGDKMRQTGNETGPVSLNTRNLLCLRALLNLGIALGPTLESAWSIVLETLQQADLVLFTSGKTAGRTPAAGRGNEQAVDGDANTLMANFANEVRSVEVAASRLIESTIDFPNVSFVQILNAMCGLLETQQPNQPEAKPEKDVSRATSPSSPRTHRRVLSFSAPTSATSNQEQLFALAKIGEIIAANMERMLEFPPEASGWDIATTQLITTLSSSSTNAPVRIKAAEVTARFILEVATSAATLEDAQRGPIQLRLLGALREALLPIHATNRSASPVSLTTELEIHRIALEGLRGILEQCGESLIEGWDIAFEIIGTVFISKQSDEATRGVSATLLASRSSKLVRSAFGSLQLICSDFLSALPNSCFLILVDTLYKFSSQDEDLNIALTTVTFFWVLSDFLSSKSKSLPIAGTEMEKADVSKLTQLAADSSAESSSGALWMLLLLRLTAVSSDDRLELRNSAIQTLLRIFDAYGTRLSPEAWSICIKSVVFKLLNSIQKTLGAVDDDDDDLENQDLTEWHGTAVVVLEGVSSLLSNYIDVLTTHTTFNDLWSRLLDYFASLLDLHVLGINTATFKALSLILSQDSESDSSEFSPAAIIASWDLWSRGIPISDVSTTKNGDNQESLLAYLVALNQVYRLLQPSLTIAQVQRILELVKQVAIEASPTGYVADIEHLTRLQTQLLQAVGMIRTDITGVPSIMLTEISKLAVLAYELDAEHKKTTKKTYVALSRESIKLLQTVALKHADDKDIYSSGAITAVLTSLCQPIAVKYDFPITSKSLATWKVATSSALAILAAALPQLLSLSLADTCKQDIWAVVVKLANGILQADCTKAVPETDIKEDEDFDMAAFARLRSLIIPGLGSDMISDKTRKSYAESLFQTSIIHTPTAADDAIIRGGSDQGLAALYDSRVGRTLVVAPTSRARMAYVAFDELFALVSATNSQLDGQSKKDAEHWTRLACTAAPLVILRCALTLRSYVADQPLRGKMPQPLSQKKELLWVLKRLVELKSANEAIPELQGAQSDSRKHLLRLYPLLVRALAVGGDEKVERLLREALDVIGNELGVV